MRAVPQSSPRIARYEARPLGANVPTQAQRHRGRGARARFCHCHPTQHDLLSVQTHRRPCQTEPRQKREAAEFDHRDRPCFTEDRLTRTTLELNLRRVSAGGQIARLKLIASHSTERSHPSEMRRPHPEAVNNTR